VNAGRRRLVIVNPNANARVTLWLADEARRVAGKTFEVVAVNARSGIEAIEKPEHLEVAACAVASEVAEHGGAAGAVVAGFGDPGLEAARALGLIPVAGLGESGMTAAALDGRRFSIVTLGAAMREPILAKAASLDLASQLAEVLALPFSIAEMVEDRDAARAEIVRAVLGCQDGAVLLGGAPFAGIAAGIARETGRIVLDGVEACIETVDRLARARQQLSPGSRPVEAERGRGR
jgi:allantoin racemase